MLRADTTILVAASMALLHFLPHHLPDSVANAQVSIPPRYDGFVYGGGIFGTDKITIEAFFDPICPDSRDAWPPLKVALAHYGSLVSLIVHPFALPYHDNAFLACRALHIVNKLNSSATYDTLEKFFRSQEEFYNQQTYNISRAAAVKKITKLAVEVVGKASYSAVENGFRDRQTDLITRVSFKYGCSRGVYGTPFFFVNGFQLPNAGSALDYNGWRSIIDPLVREDNLKPLNYNGRRSYIDPLVTEDNLKRVIRLS